MTLDVDSPAPCRPWSGWRDCTCPRCADDPQWNRLREVVLVQLKWREKIIEWCEDSDPRLATDPSLDDLESWIAKATGHRWDEVEDWMDVARFHGDDSEAPCCDPVMICHCPDCDPTPIPGIQSLPVVTGRLLEGRSQCQWEIDNTMYSPVDHWVDLIARVDAYLASAHGLDEYQRHALSGLLDDGELTFDQAVRALRLVAAVPN